MNYLVTGGSGFIGSALVKRLLREGHEVRVLDNHSRGQLRRLDSLADSVEILDCDVRDAERVVQLSKGCDAFLHLAAVNGTENFYEKPEMVLDVGVRGMLSALEACRKNSIGNLVVASSSEAYQTPPIVPTPEDVPLIVPDVLNPRYSYGGSKIISELMAINYTRENFDRCTIFRPHNVYGPDMGWEHVLPQFAIRASDAVERQSKGVIEYDILGDGEQTRAFINIHDFIDGLMIVIDSGEHHGVYHIGNPEEISIRQVVKEVFSYFDREAEILPGEPVPGETLRRCPNIDKLTGLGFCPKINIAQGLPELVEWYHRNKSLCPKGDNPLIKTR